ncbi:MAG: class B sortase [Faecalibacterium sp.]
MNFKMTKKVKIALIAACATVFAIAAGYLVHYFVTLNQNSEIYEALQQSAISTQAPVAQETAVPETQVDGQAELLEIDFEALHQTNPDIYAWIDIPDNEVSYPIAQHESDNAYYLNYTIEGVYGLPGSIYTETWDALDFSDFNTVIYGHNMANDTMFGSLNNYRAQSYFDAHHEIVIYTETETRVYQVFAAVVYDDRYIPYVYDDADSADRQAFLDSIYNNGNSSDIIDTAVTVTTDSQIITLSTCIGDMPDNRYLVVAVYQGE